MKKENIYNGQEKSVREDYFIGEVIIKEILGNNNSLEQEMYHVTFNNGALTSIHLHESEQILIATKGTGIVVLLNTNDIENFDIDACEMEILKEGDVVCIPSNRLHFHGSLPNSNFSHIAYRKKHISNSKNEKIAENKWESDILEDLYNHDNKKISLFKEKLRSNISKKLQSIIVR